MAPDAPRSPARANVVAMRLRCYPRNGADSQITMIGQSPADAPPRSVRLRAGEFHHLGPLFGFVRDEFSELSGRHRHRLAAELHKPRPEKMGRAAGGGRGE